MIAIDLFAGAGGFSLAAARAGLDVVWAANHWRAAVETHSLNHPETTIECQDLQQADWHGVPAHDVLLASPACQGHSNAATRGGSGRRRGTAPQHDYLRSTAWAVVSCAEVHRPSFVVVENVREFRSWVLYQAWLTALGALGYDAQEVEIDAADTGVPQHRRRLFVVATHQRLGGSLSFDLPREGHRPARTIYDARAAGWRPVEDRPAGVRRRIQAGIDRGWGSLFVTQHVTGHRGRCPDRPLGTVTTKNHWGWVRRRRGRWETRMLTVGEIRDAMGFPSDYELGARTKTEAIKLLGNAIVPAVGECLLRQIARAA